MLGNFGAKQKLYFIVSALPHTPCPKTFPRHCCRVIGYVFNYLHLRILYCFQ